MSENPLNSVKGIFNRNQKGNNTKNIPPRAKIDMNQINQNMLKNPKQAIPNPNKKESSELDMIFINRMQEIEKVVAKLVKDIQVLDSKNPAISSKMNGILVEMIINIWKIGGIVTDYQENNQLGVVCNLLSNQEQELLKIMENPKADAAKLGKDLSEVQMCQKIINDSIRPINSTVEYYNLLMSKLSKWGFEVKDPIGQKYDVNMDIDLISFENPDPNLKEPTITETKKPEIYFKGNKILKAQVVVTKAGTK